jgi:hypothetical protein
MMNPFSLYVDRVCRRGFCDDLQPDVTERVIAS